MEFRRLKKFLKPKEEDPLRTDSLAYKLLKEDIQDTPVEDEYDEETKKRRKLLESLRPNRG